MARETVSPPEDLPAAELALLKAYREENRMPAASKSRVGMRIEASGTAPGTARWVALGAAIAAAAILGWWLTTLRGETPLHDEAAPNEQAAFGADDAAELHEVSERSPPPKPAPAPTKAVVIEEEVQPEPEPEAEPPRPKRPKAKPTPDPGPSALAQERQLLSQAWAALARGAHDEALAKAHLHAERFPRGTLKVERKAIATIAGCKAKRPGWSDKADAFLKAHGKTPLARRVREACSP